MDELLYIFKLQHSEMADKEPNRTVRNELVGHPIRRKPNDGPLISSVYFWTLAFQKWTHPLRFVRKG